MQQQLTQTWNLDTLFPGGSNSPELQAYLKQIAADITAWHQQLNDMTAPQTDAEAAHLLPVIEQAQDLDARLEETADFAYCLIAQNTGDAQAKRLVSEATKLRADYNGAQVLFDELLGQTPDDVFRALVEGEQLAPIAFYLNERREQRKGQLPAAQEMLANDLAVDGYHAWSALQKATIGKLRVPFEVEGEQKQLSVPQIRKYNLNPDRDLRVRASEALNKALEPQTELMASILNHTAGFRLQLVKHREEQSPLTGALRQDRMTEQTLNAMWETIEKNLPRLNPFYQRKAELLGLEKLSWLDLNAPLASTETKISYEEVMDFIKEQFGRFSPAMRDYVEQTLNAQWIEVADKTEKEGGAFCAYFPTKKQQRVFYSLSGTWQDINILAHELGHGYHASLVLEKPFFAQRFPTNLAETASTFGETIASDAALQHAETTEQRIDLLHGRIQNIALYLYDVYAFFLFEKDFYQERANGLVPAERLEELFQSAQKTASANAFADYPKYLWARHGHLYSTERAFYNYPYTFGYLFSTGIYAQALAEGPAFAERYAALLRDTGSMTAEQLAHKHLGVDLTQPEFWQQAIDHVMQDIEEFLRLTEK